MEGRGAKASQPDPGSQLPRGQRYQFCELTCIQLSARRPLITPKSTSLSRKSTLLFPGVTGEEAEAQSHGVTRRLPAGRTPQTPELPPGPALFFSADAEIAPVPPFQEAALRRPLPPPQRICLPSSALEKGSPSSCSQRPGLPAWRGPGGRWSHGRTEPPPGPRKAPRDASGATVGRTSLSPSPCLPPARGAASVRKAPHWTC